MGPVHSDAAAVVVTTTHFYWLYVLVFYTYMVFSHPIPFQRVRVLCFHSSLPLSFGYTCASTVYTFIIFMYVWCCARVRDLKNSTTRKKKKVCI